MALGGFTETMFIHEGASHPVFRRGHGPGVVIIHEIPGITPEVAAFGRTVADAGFTAVLPSLFGEPGKEFSVLYVAQQMVQACINREFRVLASYQSSPITNWLRALCRAVHAELGGPGVGALGMCLTGNFALSLMLDEAVMAPVLSQPSLPFPVSAAHKAGLHLSEEDLQIVKQRAADGVSVLGLRFTDDVMCPGQRFARLQDELGAGFEGIEIDSGPHNPDNIPRTAHSVLTLDLIDEEGHPTRAALNRVLDFFRDKLIRA